MEPLKNIYSIQFIEQFAYSIQLVIPKFDKTFFIKEIFNADWEDKKLKERMRHITLTLRKQLATDYKTMIIQVVAITKQLQKEEVKGQSFEWMFLPEFVELYGLDDLDTSIINLEFLTQFTSAEFAVRPFIIKYPKEMLHQMLLWANHKSKHVRRLATEGCRPRLPWAMALPKLKKDPKPILDILENLKHDVSEYVRRSVANNLNDIAKDNPNLIISIARKWLGKTVETDKLVKHACRTLLKQGNKEIMPLFGFGSVENIKILQFTLQNKNIKIGDYLEFSFQLQNTCTSINLRLEYAIYYQKANGTLSKKVYKISEKEYSEETITKIERRQSFKQISTRKFHLGLHKIAIIINGEEFKQYDFWLV